MKAKVYNRTSHDVFISADCAGGPRLRRESSAGEPELWLGFYVCLDATRLKPIRIKPKNNFEYSRVLSGTSSPSEHPRINIDQHTGSMVMTFTLTDSTGRPIQRIASAPFRVLPPIPPAHRDTLRVTWAVGARVAPDTVVMHSGRGRDHSYATVNLLLYNHRRETVAFDPCSWRIERSEGLSWHVVYAPLCHGRMAAWTLAPGDSGSMMLRLEDSPDVQRLFHREPFVTGTYRAVIHAWSEPQRRGAAADILSNTFMLAATGLRFPGLTGFVTPIGGEDSLQMTSASSARLVRCPK